MLNRQNGLIAIGNAKKHEFSVSLMSAISAQVCEARDGGPMRSGEQGVVLSMSPFQIFDLTGERTLRSTNLATA